MAGGKETPRQKMIGMMYLVLTALLALNVSKEILNAFVTVNEGLKVTIENFKEKNDHTYMEFEKQLALDYRKVKPYFDKAQAVQKITVSLERYIDSLKTELIMATEKIDRNVADTLTLKFLNNKDNYDIPTNILIGDSEDGSKGVARKLKERISDFRTNLISLIPEERREEVNIGLNTDDPKNSYEPNATWEVSNFYHTPLAATVTLLSQIKADIKNAESDALKALFKAIRVDDITFDTLMARVIPRSNYVLLGEEYQADVFLAAFNSTKNPEIVVGDVDSSGSVFGEIDSLGVEKGIGKYSFKPDKEGLHSWTGLIKVKTQSGKVKSYPFQSEYLVAKPAAVVSPDKMNVMYVGPENPLSISVPGVPLENLEPVFNGGTIRKIRNGKYMAKPRQPGNTTVVVYANINGERKNMGSIDFRIKRVPDPVAKVAGMKGGRIKKNILRAYPGVIAELENFDFNLKFNVSKYTMIIYAGGKTARVPLKAENYEFTPQMRSAFGSLQPGDKVSFESIYAVGEDNTSRKLNQISFEIIP